MTKLSQIFKSLDEFIFKILEDVKGLTQVQSMIDAMNSYGERQQKILNHILSLLVLFIPFFVVVFLFFQNYQQKRTISLKEEIIQLVAKENQSRNQIKLVENNIIGPGVIREQSDLDRIISSSLSTLSLPSDSITLTNFMQNSAGGNITQTSATINFTKFTTPDFAGILRDLVQRQKARVSAIMVEKKDKSDFLEGSFEVYHYAKNQTESE